MSAQVAQVAEVAELRELLERRFPATLAVAYRAAEAVATGIGPLDRALPGGGLPRGRLVVWSPGGGATAVLRSACAAVASRGERAAWVDGAGLLAGEFWEGLGAGNGDRPESLVLVRPEDGGAALACAELLLSSGGFGLVVLVGGEAASARRARGTTGASGATRARAPRNGGAELRAPEVRGTGVRSAAPRAIRDSGLGVAGAGARNVGARIRSEGNPAGGTVAVRLSRAAREGGGAFVWLREGSEPLAALRLRSRIPVAGYRWRRDPFGEPTAVEAVEVRVNVSGLGLGREAVFELCVEHPDVRLSLEPGLVDRRGAGT